MFIWFSQWKLKKNSNVANNLEDDVITVNIFFVHWLKELDIKRYGEDVPILPLTNTVEICKYSDAILKHMESDALETFQSNLLYSKKKSACQLVKIGENITRLKMPMQLKKQMTTLTIDLTNFLINFRMNIITWFHSGSFVI